MPMPSTQTTTLRTKLIRLAKENPKLRESLLPLLSSSRVAQGSRHTKILLHEAKTLDALESGGTEADEGEGEVYRILGLMLGEMGLLLKTYGRTREAGILFGARKGLDKLWSQVGRPRAASSKQAGRRPRLAGGVALYEEYRDVQEGFMDRLGKFAQKQGKKDGYVVYPRGMKFLVSRVGPDGKPHPDHTDEVNILFPGGAYTELHFEMKRRRDSGRWNVAGLSPEGVYYQKLKPLLDEKL